jgi:hypothetical protein
MVLHHITVMKCVSGCRKIILDTGLDVDVKLQFHGLHTHLTGILSTFSVEMFENQALCK